MTDLPSKVTRLWPFICFKVQRGIPENIRQREEFLDPIKDLSPFLLPAILSEYARDCSNRGYGEVLPLETFILHRYMGLPADLSRSYYKRTEKDSPKYEELNPYFEYPKDLSASYGEESCDTDLNDVLVDIFFRHRDDLHPDPM